MFRSNKPIDHEKVHSGRVEKLPLADDHHARLELGAGEAAGMAMDVLAERPAWSVPRASAQRTMIPMTSLSAYVRPTYFPTPGEVHLAGIGFPMVRSRTTLFSTPPLAESLSNHSVNGGGGTV